MANITIKNLDAGSELSLQDLSANEVNATRGGAFVIAVIGAAWLGYRIAKEVKSHL